jgi:hypothetical protein
VVGAGNVWVVEGRADYGGGQIAHVANVVEFRDGRIWRETRYDAEPRPSAKPEPEPAGRSDADLEPQVQIACRRPASNAPILQGDLAQDGEHIRWRDPEAAQVPDDSPVQPTLRVK